MGSNVVKLQMFNTSDADVARHVKRLDAQFGREGLRSRGPLKLLSPGECADSPPRGYIWKGVIAPRDVGIIFGQPGSGKSVIAPHIAYAMAQGRDVFGRRCKQGKVFYIPAEDPFGMRQRVAALRLEHGDAPDFFLVDGVSDLFTETNHLGNHWQRNAKPSDVDPLYDLIIEHQPVAVFIDTIASAFPGMNGNDEQDMGRVVSVARNFTDYGAAVFLVHHAAKAEGSNTPRGHGILNGDADVAIFLHPGADTGVIGGTMTKNRNGPCDARLSFTIRAVRLGVDEDGDAITAPVAAPVAMADISALLSVGGTEAKALRYLTDAIAEHGEPLPDGSGVRGVPEEAWRQACEDRQLSKGDAASRKRAFRRAVNGLMEKQKVTTRDGMVWPTDPEGAS